MKGSLAVAERDIRKFLRQPALIIGMIIGPLLTLILLGSAFGGAITHVPIAIVQESYGPYSLHFMDILRNEQSCQVRNQLSEFLSTNLRSRYGHGPANAPKWQSYGNSPDT